MLKVPHFIKTHKAVSSTDFIQEVGEGKGSEATHSSLEMQLVRVPRLRECLILWAEATGWGLQDSLGSSRVPEKSLFTAHLISGSWRGSRKTSGSEESHCLWEKQTRQKKKRKEVWQGLESSAAPLNGLWFAASRSCKWLTNTNVLKSGKTTLTTEAQKTKDKSRSKQIVLILGGLSWCGGLVLRPTRHHREVAWACFSVSFTEQTNKEPCFWLCPVTLRSSAKTCTFLHWTLFRLQPLTRDLLNLCTCQTWMSVSLPWFSACVYTMTKSFFSK